MKNSILTMMASVGLLAMTSCVGETTIPPYDSPWVDPVGTGAVNAPFNCSAAINECQVVGQTTSSEWYFITGYVVGGDGIDTSRGNATFEMADEPDAQGIFTAYRISSFDMQKFTDAELIKVGDKITIFAPIINYNGKTPETNYGMLYAINDEVGGVTIEPEDPDAPSLPDGEGTEDSPFNVPQIIQFAKDTGTAKSEPVYFTGYITLINELNTGNYGNATFYISNKKGGREMFYVYQVYDLEGKKFTDPDKIKVGDLVVIKSPVLNYNNSTPETSAREGNLVSITR